jgi:hypothetical protein
MQVGRWGCLWMKRLARRGRFVHPIDADGRQSVRSQSQAARYQRVSSATSWHGSTSRLGGVASADSLRRHRVSLDVARAGVLIPNGVRQSRSVAGTRFGPRLVQGIVAGDSTR